MFFLMMHLYNINEELWILLSISKVSDDVSAISLNTSVSELLASFRSVLAYIVHSTAVHYIGISKQVSDFGQSESRFLCWSRL